MDRYITWPFQIADHNCRITWVYNKYVVATVTWHLMHGSYRLLISNLPPDHLYYYQYYYHYVGLEGRGHILFHVVDFSYKTVQVATTNIRNNMYDLPIDLHWSLCSEFVHHGWLYWDVYIISCY